MLKTIKLTDDAGFSAMQREHDNMDDGWTDEDTSTVYCVCSKRFPGILSKSDTMTGAELKMSRIVNILNPLSLPGLVSVDDYEIIPRRACDVEDEPGVI